MNVGTKRTSVTMVGMVGLTILCWPWRTPCENQAEWSQGHSDAARRRCQTCHGAKDRRAGQGDPAAACESFCTSCHADRDGHHPVGRKIEDRARLALPLSTSGAVTCVTCHDLHNQRYDQRSWRSQSLFGRIFGRKRLYPTYYLRVNNSSGQLCRKCH